ncbi:MAG: hypothetical protein CSA86_04940 [Arcobacter sp.]|nr:MAG: hypothetical protein CSA86_04940 [Arcobacter sp.]
MLYELYKILEKSYINEILSKSQNKHTIVNHNIIIQNFLNRLIIEPDYFKVYSNLLSFEEYEFYTLEFNDLYQDDTSFAQIIKY